MAYKLYKTTTGDDAAFKTNEDGSTISFNFDPTNTDYQAYLQWLSLGNTPQPPDNKGTQ